MARPSDFNLVLLESLQLAKQADDPWCIAYQDESSQWFCQKMDLEDMVANLGVELAHKNQLICDLKHTVEEEKKNPEIIHKEKLTLDTDLAACDQVIQDLQVMVEEKIKSCG
jgi:hypothetical protein